jgi:hypothetical protein
MEYTYVYDADGLGVADTWRDRPKQENLANARLIAAAPELATLILETIDLLNDWLAEDLSDQLKSEMALLETRLQIIGREIGAL